MVQALPGTYLVHIYFDNNQVELVRANVVGWSVGSDRRIAPLVLDPRATDDDPWRVIHPDGRVESSCGKVWDTLDAFIDDEKRASRAAA